MLAEAAASVSGKLQGSDRGNDDGYNAEFEKKL
jgi:hypothetical protein